MKYYRLDLYVPDTHLEKVKKAVLDAGAGKTGNYDSCCWRTSGKGQFRPLSGANPFYGTENKLETIEEWKVELICTEETLSAAIKALKATHPYETPAFQYWQVETD